MGGAPRPGLHPISAARDSCPLPPHPAHPPPGPASPCLPPVLLTAPCFESPLPWRYLAQCPAQGKASQGRGPDKQPAQHFPCPAAPRPVPFTSVPLLYSPGQSQEPLLCQGDTAAPRLYSLSRETHHAWPLGPNATQSPLLPRAGRPLSHPTTGVSLAGSKKIPFSTVIP